MYRINKYTRRSDIQLFVSEMEFDRSMSRLTRGAEDIRTIIFPNTVREV